MTQRVVGATPASRLHSPARALLAIDRPVLAHIVTQALHRIQYRIRVTPTLDEATTALADWRPHLIIVDMDTTGTLERIAELSRNTGRPSPVIAMTHRGNLTAKLAAFDAGVDDIVTVPFSPEELVARVIAIMRRSYRDALAFAPVIRLGKLEIDLQRRRVCVGERELHLTVLEQSLLYLLAANAGQLFTRDEIVNHVWGSDHVAESNIVDRHIRNLRIKLREHSDPAKCIATVRGRGYRFLATTVEVVPE